ncbi:MAG TPA: Rpn family recombination-promoting nuclease/putative transposase, partial [Candidatus Nanopelagicales bacterium]|nr:Rpn family recombination-promoting nuclease/putative transposase [Candidatus Nanopelagicales bacterium]
MSNPSKARPTKARPAKDKREPSPQPHDTLFKWTFSQRDHAAGLLRAALPPALVPEIDFRTLRIE